MRKQKPKCPARILGGDTENLSGIQTLYLLSQNYWTHSAQDIRKFGWPALTDCIALYNE